MSGVSQVNIIDSQSFSPSTCTWYTIIFVAKYWLIDYQMINWLIIKWLIDYQVIDWLIIKWLINRTGEDVDYSGYEVSRVDNWNPRLVSTASNREGISNARVLNLWVNSDGLQATWWCVAPRGLSGGNMSGSLLDLRLILVLLSITDYEEDQPNRSSKGSDKFYSLIFNITYLCFNVTI